MAARLSPRTPTFLFVVAAILLIAAAPAAASVGVATNAAAPRLQVDAKGNAVITYTTGGARKSVLVPMNGQILAGGRLTGADVSKPARSPRLPYVKVLRKGPGGWFYALQTWPAASGPVELRFSRWKGNPTKLTLSAKQERLGVALQGKATLNGKPIPVRSPIPGGTVSASTSTSTSTSTAGGRPSAGCRSRATAPTGRCSSARRSATSSAPVSPGRTSARPTHRT
jgi:hypothetical protein